MRRRVLPGVAIAWVVSGCLSPLGDLPCVTSADCPPTEACHQGVCSATGDSATATDADARVDASRAEDARRPADGPGADARGMIDDASRADARSGRDANPDLGADARPSTDAAPDLGADAMPSADAAPDVGADARAQSDASQALDGAAHANPDIASDAAHDGRSPVDAHVPTDVPLAAADVPLAAADVPLAAADVPLAVDTRPAADAQVTADVGCQVQDGACAVGGFDCDATVGESVMPDQPCEIVQESCRSAGVWRCDPLTGATCEAEPVLLEPERCDGEDNDCDGAIDEAGPAVELLRITFDRRTVVDPGRAFIHVSDSGGNEVEDSPFTGVALADRTLEVPGHIVNIRLVADAQATPLFGWALSAVSDQTGRPAQEAFPDGPRDPMTGDHPAGPMDETRSLEVGDALGTGHACGSAVGVCETGLERCLAGRVLCLDDRRPVAEVCNGLDDDCDGLPDVEDGAGVCAHCAALRDGGVVLDGTQTVDRDGPGPEPPFDVHCHGMTEPGPTPLEYLNLTGENYSNWLPSCGAPCGAITWHFSKVRFSMDTLVVITGDRTYTVIVGDAAGHAAEVNGGFCSGNGLPYASAGSCTGRDNALGSIDLTGTPFAVHPDAPFYGRGIRGAAQPVFGTVTFSEDRRTALITGGGEPGVFGAGIADHVAGVGALTLVFFQAP